MGDLGRLLAGGLGWGGKLGILDLNLWRSLISIFLTRDVSRETDKHPNW